MKKILKTALLLSFALFIASCGGPTNASISSENDQLKQRIQNDSLLLADMGIEMEEVDDAINKIIEYTNTAAQGGGTTSSRDKAEKLNEIKQIIESSTEKISALEEKIAKSNSSFKNNAVLTKSLEAQKKLIAEQQQEIERLTGEVIVLTGKNKDLEDERGGLISTVNNQGMTIQQYEKDISTAQQRLSDLNKAISSANNDKANVNRQIDKEYFAIAKTLVEMAEDRKGSFKNAKQQREDLAKQAFGYYCKLHKRGAYEGLQEMTNLKSHKTLGKFVQYESCN
jgi:chromosome segregation ATPase